MVIRTWDSTEIILGYQGVCGLSLKPNDGRLSITFWKETVLIQKDPFDLLESTWSFKVDFDIRIYTFITYSTTRQK